MCPVAKSSLGLAPGHRDPSLSHCRPSHGDGAGQGVGDPLCGRAGGSEQYCGLTLPLAPALPIPCPWTLGWPPGQVGCLHGGAQLTVSFLAWPIRKAGLGMATQRSRTAALCSPAAWSSSKEDPVSLCPPVVPRGHSHETDASLRARTASRLETEFTAWADPLWEVTLQLRGLGLHALSYSSSD